jgi:hypothetical protein
MKRKTTGYILIALVFLAMLFTLSLLSAESQIQTLGTFKIGEAVNLVQNCLTSTYSNISRIVYPNGTFALNTQTAMTKNGDDYYYSFTDTITPGNYLVYGVCDESGIKTNWVYDFKITATGKDLTSAKATSYVIIFVVSFIIFLGLLILGIYLPSNNKSNEMTGYIIAVSNLKYLKILCLGIAYMVAVFLAYFSYTFSYAYLDMEYVTNMLRILFTVEAVLVLPLFILGVYIMITNAVRDAKIGDMLSRGLSTRGER